MDNSKGKEVLKRVLKDMEGQQENGPFPTRDSEILEEYKTKLTDGALNYDNEPVVACPNCNSLNLRVDYDMLECFKCGHQINEKDVVVYKTVYAYMESESSNDTDES